MAQQRKASEREEEEKEAKAKGGKEEISLRKEFIRFSGDSLPFISVSEDRSTRGKGEGSRWKKRRGLLKLIWLRNDCDLKKEKGSGKILEGLEILPL